MSKKPGNWCSVMKWLRLGQLLNTGFSGLIVSSFSWISFYGHSLGCILLLYFCIIKCCKIYSLEQQAFITSHRFWGSGKQEWGRSCSGSLKEVQSSYWPWLASLQIYWSWRFRLLLLAGDLDSSPGGFLLQRAASSMAFPKKSDQRERDRVAAKGPKMEDMLFLKPHFRSDFPSLLLCLFLRSESLNPAHTQGDGN